MDDGALALGYTAPTKACNDELGGCSFNSCHNNKTSAHNTVKAVRAPNNDGLNNINNNMVKASDIHPSTEKSGKDPPDFVPNNNNDRRHA